MEMENLAEKVKTVYQEYIKILHDHSVPYEKVCEKKNEYDKLLKSWLNS